MSSEIQNGNGSYIALYRKWRPQCFEDVIGQEHITDVLRGEILRGSVSHAYLFCGSRGTGKTTCAKILAKAVSCENPKNGDPCGECENCKRAASSFDITEIDAASNNGVDNIRQLREEVLYPPSEMKKRVYIIDEVHMLSISAFNALLKTLEEPPEHVLFILATTELNKIPATILSRCKRFDFHRITPENIARRLRFVCDSEGIKITDEALMLIARLAGGAMRDALSMLELFVGSTELVDEDRCARSLGVIGRGPVMKLLSAIAKNDCPSALSVISEAYGGSKDMGVLLSECADSMRDMLMIKYTKHPENFVEGTADVLAELSECASHFTKERLIYSMDILDDAQNRMVKTGISRRAVLETTVLKLCDVKLWTLPESLNTRVAQLETALASGSFVKNASQSIDEKSVEKVPEKGKESTKNAETAGTASPESAAPAVSAPETAPDVTDRFGTPPPEAGEGGEGAEVYNDFSASDAVKEDVLPGESDGLPGAPAGVSSEKAPEGVKTAPDERLPMPAFPEILEEVKAQNALLGSLIVSSNAYICGGKAYFELPAFAYRMVTSRDDSRQKLIDTAKQYLGSGVEVVICSEGGAKNAPQWDL